MHGDVDEVPPEDGKRPPVTSRCGTAEHAVFISALDEAINLASLGVLSRRTLGALKALRDELANKSDIP